jgi:pimeloyl-ACP methyl ester carboxylesterase
MTNALRSCGFALTISIFLSTLCWGQQQFGTVRFEPYDFKASDRTVPAELGHLAVPERHEQPKGKQIELAFVRFRSTAAHPRAPIVYLAGGPGNSGIDSARGERLPIFLALRQVADVIALDQRATGLSKPNLDCPQKMVYPLDQPAERETLLRMYRDKSAECAAMWRAKGVDLSAYNTNESADDLESLRKAIGAKNISLWATSYGTHLALATLRRHGGSIERAVLMGVEGPDDTQKLPSDIDKQLKIVLDLAKADPTVRQKIPDLKGTMEKVWDEAAKTPVVIPASGKRPSVTLGKFDLQRLTVDLLGERGAKRWFPATYWGLLHHDYSATIFTAIVNEVAEERQGSVGSAMSYAMDCASCVSAQRRERIAHEAKEFILDHVVDFPFMDVCGAWGVPPLPDTFRSPVQSEVPALFISGTYDGHTSPRSAEEVRRGFSHSSHLVIDGSGHGNELFVSSPEIQTSIVEFFSGRLPPDRTIHLPNLQFAAIGSDHP